MADAFFLKSMNLSSPLILTNFKTYESATGTNALALAKIHEHVAKESGKNFAIAVQAVDIRMIAAAVKIPVFAQHCDAAEYGSHTGWILPEALKEAGASGVILNHSEHRFASTEELVAAITRAQSVGLVVCVCAENAEEAAKIDSISKPEFIAVEPPELIGGDISVSTAQPKLIRDAVEMIKRSRVLVGAGVKNGEDVRIGLELGAFGVLLASGITKAADPAAVLHDLVSKV